eukprot:Selendium_serpulae@DN6274_c2_g2_i2.p1
MPFAQVTQYSVDFTCDDCQRNTKIRCPSASLMRVLQEGQVLPYTTCRLLDLPCLPQRYDRMDEFPKLRLRKLMLSAAAGQRVDLLIEICALSAYDPEIAEEAKHALTIINRSKQEEHHHISREPTQINTGSLDQMMANEPIRFCNRAHTRPLDTQSLTLFSNPQKTETESGSMRGVTDNEESNFLARQLTRQMTRRDSDALTRQLTRQLTKRDCDAHDSDHESCDDCTEFQDEPLTLPAPQSTVNIHTYQNLLSNVPRGIRQFTPTMEALQRLEMRDGIPLQDVICKRDEDFGTPGHPSPPQTTEWEGKLALVAVWTLGLVALKEASIEDAFVFLLLIIRLSARKGKAVGNPYIDAFFTNFTDDILDELSLREISSQLLSEVEEVANHSVSVIDAVCPNFNNSRGCKSKGCRLRHVCGFCQRGTHPLMECNSLVALALDRAGFQAMSKAVQFKVQHLAAPTVNKKPRGRESISFTPKTVMFESEPVYLEGEHKSPGCFHNMFSLLSGEKKQRS